MLEEYGLIFFLTRVMFTSTVLSITSTSSGQTFCIISARETTLPDEKQEYLELGPGERDISAIDADCFSVDVHAYAFVAFDVVRRRGKRLSGASEHSFHPQGYLPD